MILHASTKMDIANYIDWLRGRLSDGYFDREINGKIINRIPLDDIEKIYLYSKNPSKIYRNKDIFEKYNTRLITFMTQYDSIMEPKIKDKDKILRCIKRCRKGFKENYLGYGPIFYTDKHNEEWHLAQFSLLCHELQGYIDGVYINFDINKRCQSDKSMTCRPLDYMEQSIILGELEEIAARFNMSVEIMRHEEEFEEDEVDIGENNCCPYACRYCRYITNERGAIDKYKIFNSSSSMLYGFVGKSQKIVKLDFTKEKKEENKKSECEQVSLFDIMS